MVYLSSCLLNMFYFKSNVDSCNLLNVCYGISFAGCLSLLCVRAERGQLLLHRNADVGKGEGTKGGRNLFKKIKLSLSRELH